MKHYLLSAYIVMISLLLSACGGGSKHSSVEAPLDTIVLKYAENLCMAQGKDYTLVKLRNPWDTVRWLHTYVLVDKEQPLPKELPEGTVVRTPLNKSLLYSAVHCSLLESLKATNCIAAVCDAEYIKTKAVVEGCQNGSIVDAGNSMNPDIEKVIDLHPDAILLCPFENAGGYGRIEKLNIPLIECADYMETSPLGCAEWMRFYGRLFGKETMADSLFLEVEKSYNELKALAASAPVKPSLVCDLKSGSAWYVSGGKSTTGKMYTDAGAHYVFSHYPQSGGIPLSFETVADLGQAADFWLIKYNQQTDKTLKELKQDFAPYARFKAYQEKKVYGCNTHRIRFYEDAPFHPDLILKDLVKVFHPTLLPDYELKYFTPLTD